jgi:hypothetical protein
LYSKNRFVSKICVIIIELEQCLGESCLSTYPINVEHFRTLCTFVLSVQAYCILKETVVTHYLLLIFFCHYGFKKKIVSISNSTSNIYRDSPSEQMHEYFNSLRALDKFKLPESGNILRETLLKFIWEFLTSWSS